MCNLIGNSMKFSPRGAAISVHAATAGTEVRISVHDDGPGIPPDQTERVFDRFWQGRANDRRGSGLGLSIAKGIVEAHGGRIWVESQENHGSTFTFTLPTRSMEPAVAGGHTDDSASAATGNGRVSDAFRARDRVRDRAWKPRHPRTPDASV